MPPNGSNTNASAGGEATQGVAGRSADADAAATTNASPPPRSTSSSSSSSSSSMVNKPSDGTHEPPSSPPQPQVPAEAPGKAPKRQATVTFADEKFNREGNQTAGHNNSNDNNNNNNSKGTGASGGGTSHSDISKKNKKGKKSNNNNNNISTASASPDGKPPDSTQEGTKAASAAAAAVLPPSPPDAAVVYRKDVNDDTFGLQATLEALTSPLVFMMVSHSVRAVAFVAFPTLVLAVHPNTMYAVGFPQMLIGCVMGFAMFRENLGMMLGFLTWIFRALVVILVVGALYLHMNCVQHEGMWWGFLATMIFVESLATHGPILRFLHIYSYVGIMQTRMYYAFFGVLPKDNLCWMVAAWLVGLMLAVCAQLFPYPVLMKSLTDMLMAKVFTGVSKLTGAMAAFVLSPHPIPGVIFFSDTSPFEKLEGAMGMLPTLLFFASWEPLEYAVRNPMRRLKLALLRRVLALVYAAHGAGRVVVGVRRVQAERRRLLAIRAEYVRGALARATAEAEAEAEGVGGGGATKSNAPPDKDDDIDDVIRQLRLHAERIEKEAAGPGVAAADAAAVAKADDDNGNDNDGGDDSDHNNQSDEEEEEEEADGESDQAGSDALRARSLQLFQGFSGSLSRAIAALGTGGNTPGELAAALPLDELRAAETQLRRHTRVSMLALVHKYEVLSAGLRRQREELLKEEDRDGETEAKKTKKKEKEDGADHGDGGKETNETEESGKESAFNERKNDPRKKATTNSNEDHEPFGSDNNNNNDDELDDVYSSDGGEVAQSTGASTNNNNKRKTSEKKKKESRRQRALTALERKKELEYVETRISHLNSELFARLYEIYFVLLLSLAAREIVSFGDNMTTYAPGGGKSLLRRLWEDMIVEPWHSFWKELYCILTVRRPSDVQQYKTAVRLTCAFVAATALNLKLWVPLGGEYYFGVTVLLGLGSEEESLIMCFARMAGNTLGCCLGFMIYVHCHNLSQVIGWVMVACLLQHMPRNYPDFGVGIWYSALITIAGAVMSQNPPETLTRIIGGTYTALAFELCILLIFPNNPLKILWGYRAKVARTLSETIDDVAAALRIPLVYRAVAGAEEDDDGGGGLDNITISSRGSAKRPRSGGRSQDNERHTNNDSNNRSDDAGDRFSGHNDTSNGKSEAEKASPNGSRSAKDDHSNKKGQSSTDEEEEMEEEEEEMQLLMPPDASLLLCSRMSMQVALLKKLQAMNFKWGVAVTRETFARTLHPFPQRACQVGDTAQTRMLACVELLVFSVQLLHRPRVSPPNRKLRQLLTTRIAPLMERFAAACRLHLQDFVASLHLSRRWSYRDALRIVSRLSEMTPEFTVVAMELCAAVGGEEADPAVAKLDSAARRQLRKEYAAEAERQERQQKQQQKSEQEMGKSRHTGGGDVDVDASAASADSPNAPYQEEGGQMSPALTNNASFADRVLAARMMEAEHQRQRQRRRERRRGGGGEEGGEGGSSSDADDRDDGYTSSFRAASTHRTNSSLNRSSRRNNNDNNAPQSDDSPHNNNVNRSFAGNRSFFITNNSIYATSNNNNSNQQQQQRHHHQQHNNNTSFAAGHTQLDASGRYTFTAHYAPAETQAPTIYFAQPGNAEEAVRQDAERLRRQQQQQRGAGRGGENTPTAAGDGGDGGYAPHSPERGVSRLSRISSAFGGGHNGNRGDDDANYYYDNGNNNNNGSGVNNDRLNDTRGGGGRSYRRAKEDKGENEMDSTMNAEGGSDGDDKDAAELRRALRQPHVARALSRAALQPPPQYQGPLFSYQEDELDLPIDTDFQALLILLTSCRTIIEEIERSAAATKELSRFQRRLHETTFMLPVLDALSDTLAGRRDAVRQRYDYYAYYNYNSSSNSNNSNSNNNGNAAAATTAAYIKSRNVKGNAATAAPHLHNDPWGDWRF